MTKQDKEFVESPGHPDLSDGLPKTTKASFANKPHSTGSQGAESVRHDSTDCNEESSQGRGQKNNININRNDISVSDVAQSVRTLLEKGRGKV